VNNLRTISTRRLLVTLSAVCAACLATAAVALAAVGSGPVPASGVTLAQALNGSLQGGGVSGVTAQISFTNNLFSGASFQTPDPLLTGASGRLWATQGHLRLELQGSNGDSQIVVDGSSVWAYDPASNTVYEGTLPSQPSAGGVSGTGTVPSVSTIQAALTKASQNVSLSNPRATDIGGQPAYVETITPKSSAGLIGALRIGFDANHAVPLEFALIPRGQTAAALALEATSISYGPVPASVFQIAPPAGAHVVTLSFPTPATNPAPDGSATGGSVKVVGSGLGSVIVAQHAGTTGSTSAGSGALGSLPLQTVSINGAAGKQLPTSLGTVLEFTRNGVSYLLAGSVSASTIDSIARGL
jgi:outer membrane lipoprotein-sorting protein